MRNGKMHDLEGSDSVRKSSLNKKIRSELYRALYLQGVYQSQDGENEQSVSMLAGLVALVIGRNLDIWPRANKLCV